jgi:hypothetical protein
VGACNSWFRKEIVVIVVMNPHAPQPTIDRVMAEIQRMGGTPHLSRGEFRTVIGAVGEEAKIDQAHLLSLDGVEKVLEIMKPYKLASREFHEDDSVVEVGGGKVPVVKVGGKHAVSIAGPCAVENRQMLRTIAGHVRKAGATILRGGVFKPRTSPYSFQGHGEPALKWMRECGDELGMPICVEVMDTRQVETMEQYVDCFQIGARNMQNFDLLREVGKTRAGGHGQGLAAVGRVCALAGQPQRDPMRARHQDLRGFGPLLAGSYFDPDRATVVAPADHRRSIPLLRQARVGSGHGGRRHRGRGARDDH